MNKSLNILIADTQPVFRDGLDFVIRQRMDVNQIFHADKQREVLSVLKDNAIDIIVMDFFLLDCSAIQIARTIINRSFEGVVVFLTAEEVNNYSALAAKVGARGCLSKNEDSNAIVDAIVTASKGYSIFKRDSLNERPPLSIREQTVFDYLIKGHNNQEIANILSLSEKTISTYKSRVLRKFNAKSIVEIATR
ncbi:response regulator transcription factor [Vibrio parahaemolyticus]|uniref:response regulator transcription factor n=1 Tax=Vibrio parahaemolyticus TaxID=670 RepID=UPI001E43046C|nr:response regulator transcription factor [Vibrio parahaemolyticus]